jgi:hypothetical protein
MARSDGSRSEQVHRGDQVSPRVTARARVRCPGARTSKESGRQPELEPLLGGADVTLMTNVVAPASP